MVRAMQEQEDIASDFGFSLWGMGGNRHSAKESF